MRYKQRKNDPNSAFNQMIIKWIYGIMLLIIFCVSVDSKLGLLIGIHID